MIKYPQGAHLLVEVPAVIDNDGDAKLGEVGDGETGIGLFTIGDTAFIGASALQRLNVRVAPVEIATGRLYRDATGKGYIGSWRSGAVSDGVQLYGPDFPEALPAGLVEVTA